MHTNIGSTDFILDVNGMTDTEAQRFETIVASEVATVAVAFDENIVPLCTKDLLDFSGNAYTLIECEPTGYMIYHNASGQFVEMSATGPSPYVGFDTNLFYGGPTEYYVLENSMYIHTVVDEVYNENVASDVFQESCDIANEYFLSDPATAVLQYIEQGIPTLASGLAESRASTLSVDAPTYITNAYCISNCETESEMSYFGMNACGYIAAAMLLLWFRDTIDSNYLTVNNSNGYNYVTIKNYYPVFNGDPDTYYDGRTFSYNLWRWHSEFGKSDYENGYYITAAGDIAKTIESYLSYKGIRCNNTVDLLPSTATVISRLDTFDRPYILFGNLQPVDESRPNKNHAVLAYGHWNGYILCNFGWEDYSCSSVKGAWGSGYMLR